MSPGVLKNVQQCDSSYSRLFGNLVGTTVPSTSWCERWPAGNANVFCHLCLVSKSTLDMSVVCRGANRNPLWGGGQEGRSSVISPWAPSDSKLGTWRRSRWHDSDLQNCPKPLGWFVKEEYEQDSLPQLKCNNASFAKKKNEKFPPPYHNSMEQHLQLRWIIFNLPFFENIFSKYLALFLGM